MFGQIPDFTNGFDFMRRLWGSGSGMPAGLMPGLQAMTPPMDLDDLDKRIADLKAVESWLQLNTNLLRTTIQGLEVQRATLVALQTFGNALSPESMQSAMENVARAANTPSAAAPERAAGADAGSGAQPEPPAAEHPQAAASDTDSTLPPNAALWWDLLQQQFNQIASSAAAASIAPFGMGGFGAAAGPEAAAQAPAAKPKTGAPGKAASAGTGKPAAKKAPAKKAPAKKAAKAKPAKDAGNGDDNGKNGGNNGGGSHGANGSSAA
ncbi:polyhydroxybutyrate granule multifunctional regulator PhaM [Cupriavidus sp. BIC8F]|uniref:polyhydroxybutyrate granule multifunctional regulator PhaM n=1 Tax=Cupriavidus sp. BIC8F TaxID=3079014 RepID=UPI002916F047|nr:polyhydroxybutyrate granule multifunctional regulator PhaM [Cupriavidus sp. BIC8F]